MHRVLARRRGQDGDFSPEASRLLNHFGFNDPPGRPTYIRCSHFRIVPSDTGSRIAVKFPCRVNGPCGPCGKCSRKLSLQRGRGVVPWVW